MSWFLVLKNINPNSWVKPTPEQKEKVLAEEWNILGKEIGQEILDYFKGDIPLDTWLDVNILDREIRRDNDSAIYDALKPDFQHWILEELQSMLKTPKKYTKNIFGFLAAISNLMDKTGNDKIGDEIFDLTRKYSGLRNREESRLKEANEKRLAILEEEKKESEWQKTLSIARQWGIKPNWQVERNKDADGLKEQLPPAARKKLEEKLQ